MSELRDGLSKLIGQHYMEVLLRDYDVTPKYDCKHGDCGHFHSPETPCPNPAPDDLAELIFDFACNNPIDTPTNCRWDGRLADAIREKYMVFDKSKSSAREWFNLTEKAEHLERELAEAKRYKFSRQYWSELSSEANCRYEHGGGNVYGILEIAADEILEQIDETKCQS
jgi:hypothetical protein